MLIELLCADMLGVFELGRACADNQIYFIGPFFDKFKVEREKVFNFFKLGRWFSDSAIPAG